MKFIVYLFLRTATYKTKQKHKKKHFNSEYFYTWAFAYKRLLTTGPPAEIKVRPTVEYQCIH